MIGRGTRLCPDVFGPYQPKEYFLIFDVCQNFEFFNVNQKGREALQAKPITQQIFLARLQLSRLLAETGKDENLELASSLLDILHKSIANLDPTRFQVGMHQRYVDEFKIRKRWNNLSADDLHQIEIHLSSLPNPETINETARRFDLMMLKMQIAKMLMLASEKGFQHNLVTIAVELGQKYTIPQVKSSKELIENMKDPEFYKKLTIKNLEDIREEIRELVQYLELAGRTPIYTNIQDSVAEITSRDPIVVYEKGIYKKRVESYIRENKDQLVIHKLQTNQAITTAELEQLEKILFDNDERGSKEDYVAEYGEQPLGVFVRSIIGLDIEAANQAFADFLQAGNLKADQMTFINNIITHLTINGTIDKTRLFESPFTDINDQGLLGVFSDAEAVRLINIIDKINGNAGVA
jgi:type I restriction enzyme R subunit